MVKPRRIRIYSPDHPFSRREGAHQVIASQVDSLLNLGQSVEIVSWRGSRDGSTPANARLKIVQIPPFSNASRAGRVVRSVFGTRSSTDLAYYPKLSPAAREFLRKEPADLEIWHYSFACDWLRIMEKVTKRVVVMHNLESRLAGMRATESSKRLSPFALLHLVNLLKLKKSERELRSLVDELWFISPTDLELYRALNGDTAARLVPPGFSPSLLATRQSAYRNLSHPQPVFGFIGNISFLPNRLAVEWLLHRLAPELARMAFAGEIWIAGSGVDKSLMERASQFRFVRVLGFLDNPDRDYWSHLSGNLVPSLGGSGVQIKLLEALASGIPCACSRGALPRLHPSLRSSPLLIASDDPHEWAHWLCLPETQTLRSRNASAIGLPDALNSDAIYREILSS